MSSAGASRTRWSAVIVPAGILLLGLVGSLWLLLMLPERVFFSGDAGPRYLLARQFAAGDLRPDLQFQLEPWVRELWEAGLRPFHPVFVFDLDGRYWSRWPIFFPLLTAPLQALLGFRGLLIVPLLSLWATWGVMLLWLRRWSAGQGTSALAMGALVLASPLTVYGALYWEHTLAVALAFGGLALAFTGGSVRAVFAGGVLLGLAAWFRLETGLLSVAVLGLVALRPPTEFLRGRGRWALGLGLLAALAALALWNLALYHRVFGLQWERVVNTDPGADSRLFREALLASLFSESFPFFVAALLCALLLLPGGGWKRVPPAVWTLAWASLLLVLVAPQIAPADGGGTQVGARYLLPAIPLTCLWGACVFRELWAHGTTLLRTLGFVIVVSAIAWGHWELAEGGFRRTFTMYTTLKAPALRFVEKDPAHVVLVQDAFIGQELAAAMGPKEFVLAANAADIRRTVIAAAEHGQARLLLLTWKSDHPSAGGSSVLDTPRGPLAVTMAPLGSRGLVDAYALTLTTGHRQD